MTRGHTKIVRGIIAASAMLAVVFAPLQTFASPALSIAAPAGLSFTEIKMTGDEFVIFQNNTGKAIPNLASYWLYGFNNVDPLANAVSSSSQQLPTGSLGEGQTLLLSANGMSTCGAAMAGKLSISLTDSGGFLQVAQTSMQNGAVMQVVNDKVSWSSAATGDIASVPSSSKAPNALWYRYELLAAAGASKNYGWQRATLSTDTACQYDVATADPEVAVASISGLQPPTSAPPVTIVSVEDTQRASGAPAASLPAADVGLQSPVVNELLPNPASPAMDDSDEYIELYNPNDSVFDLSGFLLQTASSASASAKTYTFPAGTSLPGKGFTAFTSKQTHLSMSNSGGQVWLLDPFASVISQSATYGTAKDGQVWSLANGKWLWSSSATPGKANVITAVKTAAVKRSTTSSKTVVSKKTAAGGQNGIKATSAGAAANASGEPEPVSAARIHTFVLAAVAVLAVLYGAYEYRHDISNKFHELKEHRADRRTGRDKTAWRRGYSTEQ